MSNPASTPDIQTTLEKALIDSIDGIKKTGTELVDALYAQAPEVIEQLLLWNGIESFLTFLFSILVLTAPLIHYKVVNNIFHKLKVENMKDKESSLFYVISALSGLMVLIASIGISTSYCNITWLKIWISPKVYLIEYFANFIK